jgi:hypothetical protein
MLATALALGLVTALSLTAAPAAAAGGTARHACCPAGAPHPEIQIAAGHHASIHGRDQLRIICIDGDGDRVDVGLPLSWVRFLVRHVDGEVVVGKRPVDLGDFLETLEKLDEGEEILIRDGRDRIRIWIE